jgi:hypothetical protein
VTFNENELNMGPVLITEIFAEDINQSKATKKSPNKRQT